MIKASKFLLTIKITIMKEMLKQIREATKSKEAWDILSR